MATSYTSSSWPRPLRVALIAPLISPIAQPFIGGAQVFLHDLAIELSKRGHEVTLFGATGSKIEARTRADTEAAGRVQVVEVPVQRGEFSPADFNSPNFYRETDPSFFRQGELFLQVYLQVNKAQPSFDVCHAMAYDWPVFAYSPLSGVPAVHTLQLGGVDPRINAMLHTTYRQTGSSWAVTISHACASTFDLAGQEFAFDRIIYNGIDTASIPFGEEGEDFLLFAGRMTPEKGPDLAIEIARRANKKLIMAGGIYDPEFFESRIVPELEANPDIDYRGQLRREEVYRLMSRADGVLFTSRWEEPYGLVLAESLAAGAPVISWRRGAAPEIIDDGQTGFLLPLEDLEGAVAAVDRLGQIDRAECRKRMEERFSLAAIAAQYEDYYYEVIKRWPER